MLRGVTRPESLVDELADYYDFLDRHAPFSELEPEALARAVRSLEVAYYRSGAVIFDLGEKLERLFVVRKGAVELFDADGQLVAREGEGEAFGFPALMTGVDTRRRATCVEDTLVYILPEEQFRALRAGSERFDRYFNMAHEERLRSIVHDEAEGPDAGLLARPVRALIHRVPVFVPPEATVREAAELMARERISSALIGANGTLMGILTDRDLRTRVLAEGRDGTTPVLDVMTPAPIHVDAEDRALEALLAMTLHRIHHLPVTDDGKVLGVVSATDLLRLQAAHPVYIVKEVYKQTSTDGLARVSRRLPGLVQRLAQADLRAAEVGRVVSFVADALTTRLIQLAEEELGPPPARFAWVGLGSQARSELGLNSDQDNALVLEAGAEAHDAYFAQLARRVVDGLNACGFPYCPGEVMAITPKWRQPVDVWARYFDQWVATPEPKAMMHTSVFFDMRTVHGDDELVKGVRTRMLEKAAVNQRFLACLARNALEYRPPLGFFRQFVLEQGGGEGKALDLKKRGLVPVVGLARMYALASGSPEVETRARIRDAAERKALNRDDAASLLDAHAFIAQVRLRHQTQQLAEGAKPDNFVPPDTLSSFERSHLKDAFKVVQTLQTGLEYRYKTGMLG